MARIVLSKEVRARVEAALVGITEEALRGRIRRVMLRAARTDEWKRRQGWTPCPRYGILYARAAAPPPRRQLDMSGKPCPGRGSNYHNGQRKSLRLPAPASAAAR